MLRKWAPDYYLTISWALFKAHLKLMAIETEEKAREAAAVDRDASGDRSNGGGRGEYGKPPPKELLDLLPQSQELLEAADAN